MTPTAAEIARAVQALEHNLAEHARQGVHGPLYNDCCRFTRDHGRTLLAALAAAEADRASAVQAEREACASVADTLASVGHSRNPMGGEGPCPFAPRIAAAIRARGTVRPTDSERKEGDDA